MPLNNETKPSHYFIAIFRRKIRENFQIYSSHSMNKGIVFCWREPIIYVVVNCSWRQPKAPFSTVTTPRCRGGCDFIPWMTPLYPLYVPYNADVKQGGIMYHFFKKSLVWLNLGLNPSLLDHWRTLYPLHQYKGQRMNKGIVFYWRGTYYIYKGQTMNKWIVYMEDEPIIYTRVKQWIRGLFLLKRNLSYIQGSNNE